MSRKGERYFGPIEFCSCGMLLLLLLINECGCRIGNDRKHGSTGSVVRRPSKIHDILRQKTTGKQQGDCQHLWLIYWLGCGFDDSPSTKSFRSLNAMDAEYPSAVAYELSVVDVCLFAESISPIMILIALYDLCPFIVAVCFASLQMISSSWWASAPKVTIAVGAWVLL